MISDKDGLNFPKDSSAELNRSTNRSTIEQPQIISSTHESRLIIDQVLTSATKTIRIFDYDLSDPGYCDPERIKLLELFLLANRRNQVQITLHQSNNLDRNCARLMALFRRHPDAFAIRNTLHTAKQASDALVIADEHSYWRQLHRDHPRAVFAILDNKATMPLVNRFMEIWESSAPAVSANVLGL